jgi:hypothetical protein
MTDINYKYLWMAFLWIGGFLIGMAIQHEIDSSQIENAYTDGKIDGWVDVIRACGTGSCDQAVAVDRLHNSTFVNSPNHMGD